MEVIIKQEKFSGKECYTAEIFESTLCVGQGDTVQEAYDEAMENYEAKKKFEAKDKPQHEFKVGDRVQFKTWEEMEKAFGGAEYCNYELSGIELPNGLHFTSYMKYLCGTYATISKVSKSRIWLKDFTAEEADGTLFIYTSDMLKPAENEPQWQFTEDEKTILRNIDEGYNWLARDKYDALMIFHAKPKKLLHIWSNECYRKGFPFKTLFDCIKWSDDEPCEFRKFL